MSEHETPSRAGRPSWILFFGLVLCAIGLARPQDGNNGGGTQAPIVGQLQQFPPMTGAGGTADSNGRMIAVTGVDITGSSILYVIDTVNPHLAVYQAAGGGSNEGLRFVGARRIDLDLQLDGWNDRSQESFKSLEEKFIKNNLLPADGGR